MLFGYRRADNVRKMWRSNVVAVLKDALVQLVPSNAERGTHYADEQSHPLLWLFVLHHTFPAIFNT